MLVAEHSSATRSVGTLALAVLLIGPGLGPFGCDGITGIDDLSFERGVDSMCGPDAPCPDGTFCDLAQSSCQPQRPLGTTCTRIEECQSGRCVHGLCCNGPCNASCLACDLPGSEGYCDVVPPGEDPHNQCRGTTACNAKGRCEGRCLWSWADGDSGTDVATHVATDALGEIYVLGTFEGTVEGPLTSEGGSDVFLTKLSADGERRWSQSFGSLGHDQAAGLAVDPQGNVVLAANFVGPVVIDAIEYPVDGADAAILELDGDGNLQWLAFLGYPNNSAAFTTATALAVDGQGHVIVTGHFT